LFLLVAFLGTPEVLAKPTTGPVPTLQPVCKIIGRGTTAGGVEDTTLAPGYPSMGTNERIAVTDATAKGGANMKGLLKFSFASGAIPTGADIQSAQVVVQPIEDVGEGTFAVRLVTASWSEATTTAANFDLATGVSASTFRTVPFRGARPISFDVTQLVADWMAGSTPNQGFLFVPAGPTPLSVGSAESSRKPYLSVCYQPSMCTGKADGQVCHDAYACIANGACQAGVCVGRQPAAAGIVCRPSVGPCDVAERCDGTSTHCPAAAIALAGPVCRPTQGPCDIAEACDGASFECPFNVLESDATVCRKSEGACDVPEHCTGNSPHCPSDRFLPASTTCREAKGKCDIAEHCTGSAAVCPEDAKQPEGHRCHARSGVCDTDGACDGTSPDCPHDQLLTSSSVCRPSTGPCDLTETCSGSSAACPPDGHVPEGQSCGVAHDCRGGHCISCGNEGGVCCGNTKCNTSTLICVAGGCRACGYQNGPCCSGHHCNSSTLACQGGTCKAPQSDCGVLGKHCCGANQSTCYSTPDQPLVCKNPGTANSSCAWCGKLYQFCCGGQSGCDNGLTCTPNGSDWHCTTIPP